MSSFRYATAAFVVCLAVAAWGVEPGYLDYRSVELDNGLRVITLEDFSCPIVNVNLWYHVGSKDEDPNRQGFAHMFEHMMFRGTDRLGPTSHFDLVRRAGGRCNGYTSFDQTVYYEALPANQIELALWLEAERMSFLKIDQASFDTERKVVEEERRLGLNAPYGTLNEEALAEVFKVHPYRWSPIGNIPHLRASSVPELRAFWTSHYTPNNAVLVIVGAVRHEEAQALAQRYFGWIPRYPDPPRVTVREPMPDQPKTIVFKQDNAPAPLVGLGYRTAPASNDDLTALQFLGRILAGGDSSRAYRRLVSEKGLAVQISWFDWSLEQDGVFVVGAALHPTSTKYDEALAALEEEVALLRSTPVTDRELTKARNQMLRNLVTEDLYVSSKASVLGRATVVEGDTARVNKRSERIRSITPERLLEAAQKYFDPQRVFRGKVEANVAGLFSKKKSAEDDAPVTAPPETNPPPAGRPGVSRPPDFPASPPFAGLLEYDPTPQFETRSLANGLKVVVVTNHEVPFVSFQLGFRAGAWTEDKPGTAAMAMNMLTKGGTAKHTAEELADELDTYAIWLGGYSGMDNAAMSGGCLTEHLERAVNLMAEAILTPRFDPQEFEKRRKEEMTSLSVQEQEPSYIAWREFERRLYGEHPYARRPSGCVADIEALAVKDLRNWWKRFGRPDMAVLYFAGDVEMGEAIRLAEAAFGQWKAKGKQPKPEVPTLPESRATHIYLVDKEGDQVQIRVGQRGITHNDPRYFNSRVVSGYFGGAFGSRLNDTLRVKKGLTYGAGGGYSAQRLAGQFALSTFTKVETAADAVQTCLDEIRRLRDEPPAPVEIDDTKAYIAGTFPADHETPQQIMGDLWFTESNGLPADYFAQLLKGVAETTADQCVELAKTTLDPDRLIIVVTGPAEKLKPSLETIAPVTVVPRGEKKDAIR